MAGTVEIKDRIQPSSGGPSILAVNLADLLESVAPYAQALSWRILELEAVGDLGRGRNVLDLEERIARPPNGLAVSWGELLDLAHRLDQVINGLFIGAGDPSAAALIKRGGDYCAVGDLVLEAFDSSRWTVFARDNRVLQRLHERFHDVTAVPVPSFAMSH